MKKQNLNEQLGRIKSIMGLINEDEMGSQEMQMFQNELSNAGIGELSPEEVAEINPECPISNDVSSEHQQTVEKYEAMSIDQLKAELKNLKSQLNEQNWPTGGGNPNDKKTFISIAIGLVSLVLITKLFGKIFRGGGNRDCRKKNRLFRRFGPAGVV